MLYLSMPCEWKETITLLQKQKVLNTFSAFSEEVSQVLSHLTSKMKYYVKEAWTNSYHPTFFIETMTL